MCQLISVQFQVALVIKSPPANVQEVRSVGSIGGPGRSPGEGNVNSLQYSRLENPMARGAWDRGYSSWGSQRVGYNLATK